MPTYEYICHACDHEFELFQQMSAPVKRKCPACGRNKLQRLIGTGAGILFKGSGFYETDYRSESYRKAAEAEKKSTGSTNSDDGKQAQKNEAASPASKESSSKKKTGTARKTAD